jgi:hypothetical protein
VINHNHADNWLLLRYKFLREDNPPNLASIDQVKLLYDKSSVCNQTIHVNEVVIDDNAL